MEVALWGREGGVCFGGLGLARTLAKVDPIPPGKCRGACFRLYKRTLETEMEPVWDISREREGKEKGGISI